MSFEYPLGFICESAGHHLGISWVCFGYLLGSFRCHWGLTCVPFEYTLGMILISFGYHLGIIWVSFGDNLRLTWNSFWYYCIRYALRRRTPKARTQHCGRRRGRQMCVIRGMASGGKEFSRSGSCVIVCWDLFCSFKLGRRRCWASWWCLCVQSMNIWSAFEIRLTCLLAHMANNMTILKRHQNGHSNSQRTRR